jgi:hypothetical protein
VKRAPIAVLAAWLLPLGACFPDFEVGASGGKDAASDSLLAGDSGPPSDSSARVDGQLPADGGAIALVGSTSGKLDYPTPPPLKIPYSVVHAGDLLVIGTYVAQASIVVTLSDSLGHHFASTPAQSGGNAGACTAFGVTAQLWYATTRASGSDTITLSKSGNDGFGAFVLEYAGLAAGGHLDAKSSATTTVAETPMSAGQVTTSGARDVVVALFADFGAYGAMTAGAGFTADISDGNWVAMVEDDLPAGGAAPGVHEPQATLSAQSDAGLACWVGVAAAFE